MARLRCKTCGGEFDDTTRDGGRYFHACPPLSDADVKAALGIVETDEKLTTEQRAAIDAFDRTRADARNENVDRAKAKALADDADRDSKRADPDALTTAAGAGVETVSNGRRAGDSTR